MAEFLIKKGYTVYGIIRRSSSFNTQRIDHLYQDPHEKNRKLNLVYGDLNDASSLNLLIKNICPDEIYNLGAQSHVKVSFEVPEYTAEVTGLGQPAFWKRSGTRGLKLNSIRHLRRRCTARSWKPLKMKKLLFIRAALMALPRFMRIG